MSGLDRTEDNMGLGGVVNAQKALSNQTCKSDLKWRLIAFAVLTLAIGIAFWDILVDLARLSGKDETYSHMPLIPLVSAYLLFSSRERIVTVAQSAFIPGFLVIGLGVAIWLIGSAFAGPVACKDQLSLSMFVVLAMWLGGFIALFGVQSFLRASFPLLFLLFLVPIPSFMLSRIVQALQWASTEIANGLFLLVGVPFVRNGFVFELPGLSVMVARECSGIRSSISLFITGILAAHLGLNTPWRRAALMLAVVPITVFKNALRVITLSLLGAYVDPRILDSQLHRAGGIPFFGLALLIFGCVFWLLRRSEIKAKQESHT